MLIKGASGGREMEIYGIEDTGRQTQIFVHIYCNAQAELI